MYLFICCYFICLDLSTTGGCDITGEILLNSSANTTHEESAATTGAAAGGGDAAVQQRQPRLHQVPMLRAGGVYKLNISHLRLPKTPDGPPEAEVPARKKRKPSSTAQSKRKAPETFLSLLADIDKEPSKSSAASADAKIVQVNSSDGKVFYVHYDVIKGKSDVLKRAAEKSMCFLRVVVRWEIFWICYGKVLYNFQKLNTVCNVKSVLPFSDEKVSVPADKGGDARTLRTVFEYLYGGYMSEQQDIIAQRLTPLITVAEHLQIESVTEACQVLLNERCARNEVRFDL